MSLVRMCTVTVSLFRMCMCMCLRARERERREASAKASETELVPTFNSSEDGCMEKEGLELQTIKGEMHRSEKPLHILAELNNRAFVEADDLKSILGPYSPKRQLADCKEPLQDVSNKRNPKTGLQWLTNSVGEHGEELSVQDECLVPEEEAEEHERLLICSPIQNPTIAWSDCESCVVGSPTCTAYQQTADVKCCVEAAGRDEKVKTLLDELLNTDKITDTHRACLAVVTGACQCRQLPNQILASLSSACSINLLIEDDLEEVRTTREAGEEVRSRSRSSHRMNVHDGS